MNKQLFIFIIAVLSCHIAISKDIPIKSAYGNPMCEYYGHGVTVPEQDFFDSDTRKKLVENMLFDLNKQKLPYVYLSINIEALSGKRVLKYILEWQKFREKYNITSRIILINAENLLTASLSEPILYNKNLGDNPYVLEINNWNKLTLSCDNHEKKSFSSINDFFNFFSTIDKSTPVKLRVYINSKSFNKKNAYDFFYFIEKLNFHSMYRKIDNKQHVYYQIIIRTKE